MLRQILKEIQNTREPLSLSGLSIKVGVEPTALQGMIDFWVRKGRLKIEGGQISDSSASGCETSVSCGSCNSCSGPQDCPFIIKLPQTISLVVPPPE